MTVMRRMLSKVGIVGVKVDTILEKNEIVVGEEMKGIIKMKGTSIKQTIDGIHLTLSIKFERNHRKRNIHTRFDLHRVKIADKFILMANELKEIPFSFVVPKDTPITLADDLVWVHTNLDIKNAIDPVYIDYIRVQPDLEMKSIINEIENSGFAIQKIELSETPKEHKFRLPFVQEVLFIPSNDSFKYKCTNLKLIPLYNTEFKLEFLNNGKELKNYIITQNNRQNFKNDIFELLEEKE